MSHLALTPNEREELEQFRTMFGRLHLGPSTLAATTLYSSPEQATFTTPRGVPSPADMAARVPAPVVSIPPASVPPV